MKISSALFLIFSIVAFGAVVYADNPCAGDIQKYCSDVQPGGGRIKDCLMDHYKDIGDNCYASLSKMKQGQNNAESGQGEEGRSQNPSMQACAGDVKQYCSDVQHGGGRIKNCLMDHYKEISQDCYNVLSQAKNNGESGN